MRGPLLLTLTGCLLISVAPALAQETDTGVMIASFSGGGIFGVGAHGAVGGSAGFPVSRYLVPFVEFSYSPLKSYSYTYGQDNLGKGLFRSGLVDVNGGVKIRFAGKRDWVPYIGLGGGMLRFSSSTYTSGFNVTSTVHQSDIKPAGNVSVGGLYYFTRHFGFNVEVKAYVARQDHIVRTTAGVFYQFP